MKLAFIILGTTAAVFTTLAVVLADPPTSILSAHCIPVSELRDAVRQQLGQTAVSAIVSVDDRDNTLRLDESHPDAKKVRDLVTELDRLPPKAKVEATITREIRATPTRKARREIVARPTVFCRIGRPMIISFGDDAETFDIELVVTPTTE